MEELVKRARAGDRDAFADLVRQLQDGFYRVAWAILRSDADAADAMQEAVLRCWTGIADLREPAYFKTWATRILVNECYRLARQQAKATPVDAVPEEAAAESGYAQAEWQMLLSLLPERSRVVVVLHYAQGYKVAEIAQVLGANENTVKGWLATARRQYESIVSG